jgi:hypothetical protein
MNVNISFSKSAWWLSRPWTYASQDMEISHLPFLFYFILIFQFFLHYVPFFLQLFLCGKGISVMSITTVRFTSLICRNPTNIFAVKLLSRHYIAIQVMQLQFRSAPVFIPFGIGLVWCICWPNINDTWFPSLEFDELVICEIVMTMQLE